MSHLKNALVALGIILLVGFTGACGSSTPTVPKDTTGTYSNADKTFTAVVRKDLIEIFLVDEKEDFKGLYWSGTWGPGSTVISKADVAKLESSMLGSQSKTKKFVVSNDTIRFSFTAMGTTRRVTVKK